MNDTVSLTLPRNDEEALVAGATLLLTLAGKVPAMELPEVRDPCVECDSGSRRSEKDGTLKTQILGRNGDDNPELPEEKLKAFDEAVTREALKAAHSDEVRIPVEAPPPRPLVADEDGAGEDGDKESYEDRLDADGLPWDARIHSGSKAKIKDGTWRKRKGVDKEDYNRVVEELRQLMAVPSAKAEKPATGDNDLSGGETDVPPPPPVEEEPAAAPPPPPPPVESLDGYLVNTPETFTAFLKAVSHKIQAKELTMDDVTAALPEGVANLQLLNGRQDLIPEVWAKLTGGGGDE